MKKYDLFISYSRADFDEVNALVERLKEEIPGLTCWFDITGIESASEFEEKIISAISNSSYILFALSDNSMCSEWTKDEVTYVKNIGKKVIPVLLKGASLKEGWFLFKFGRIDCIDSSNTIQFKKLVGDLSKWIKRPLRELTPEKTPTNQNSKHLWLYIICVSVFLILLVVTGIVMLRKPKIETILEDKERYEALISKADSLNLQNNRYESSMLYELAHDYEIQYNHTKYKGLFNLGALERLTINKTESTIIQSTEHIKGIQGSNNEIEYMPCTKCGGNGQILNEICNHCSGTGIILHTKVQSTADNVNNSLNTEITIDTFDNSWVQMASPNAKYDAYRSSKDHSGANLDCMMAFTIKGYSTFTFYIRSNSEDKYDYVMVGHLNKKPIRRDNYANTRDVANSDYHFYSYSPVSFYDLDKSQTYTIYVTYTKDASTDVGEDRGYILIPKS